jgi:hypothetical protein
MAANLVAVRDAREKVIARLSDHFAKDNLDLDEFERRLTLVHRAETVAEIDALVADLPADGAPAASPTTAMVPRPAPAPVARADSVREKQTMVAIMGGVQRSGSWAAARHTRVIAVMGGAVLDYREARLPHGTTELSVFALMGGVHIIVPPGLAVEMDGHAFMGGFDHMERAPAEPDPERPVLHVSGFVLMGGVAVETRLPGEGDRDARRRRRRERKQLRGR